MSNCIVEINGQNVDVKHVWSWGGEYIPLGTKCDCLLSEFGEDTKGITIKLDE